MERFLLSSAPGDVGLTAHVCMGYICSNAAGGAWIAAVWGAFAPRRKEALMKVLALKSICTMLLGHIAFVCLHHPESRVDPHDASDAAVVARNLAFHHRYGVWDHGTFVACPNQVTTGPGLVLPLAAAYCCFGDWLYMPAIVTTVLTVGMLGFVWLIAVPRDPRCSLWRYFSLLVAVVALFATTVKVGEHRGFCALYGDLPAGLFVATTPR
jgi:hypothetical protein